MCIIFLQQLLLGLDNQITIYCLYIDLYLFLKDYEFCDEFLKEIEKKNKFC